LSTTLEQRQYATIRIETRLAGNSYAQGTAFIYEHATHGNSYPFLVSARSVVANAAEARMSFFQGQNNTPIPGKAYTLDVELFSQLWFRHPEDSLNIAVTPFMPFVKHIEKTGISIFFRSLDAEDPLDTINFAGIGESVLYVAYPESCWDRHSLLPVFRGGMISSRCDSAYQGLHQVLLDTIVLPGSSGSPVFLKTNGQLLGMLTNLPNVISAGNTDTVIYDASVETPMGLVIKTQAIVDTIEACLKARGVSQ